MMDTITTTDTINTRDTTNAMDTTINMVDTTDAVDIINTTDTINTINMTDKTNTMDTINVTGTTELSATREDTTRKPKLDGSRLISLQKLNEVITTISMHMQCKLWCFSQFDRRGSKKKWFSIQVACQIYSMPQRVPI